jgi:hypothetical protein
MVVTSLCDVTQSVIDYPAGVNANPWRVFDLAWTGVIEARL